MARLHSFWRGPRLGVVWGCGSLALSAPGTWARLRPGRGIFHLGGGMGRWPGPPTLQEQIDHDRLAESLLGPVHLSARCGLTPQASSQSLWTLVPPPGPQHTLCSVGPGPLLATAKPPPIPTRPPGPPGGRPDVGGGPAGVADQLGGSHPPWP